MAPAVLVCTSARCSIRFCAIILVRFGNKAHGIACRGAAMALHSRR